MSDPKLPTQAHEILNRRQLLTGAGLGMAGLLAIPNLMAGGHTGPRVVLSEEEQKALEAANDKLVADFVAAYNQRDASVLDQYVSDNIVYQITEGMADIVGREKFFKHNDNMFKGLDKVEWFNLRQHAIGQVVINERIDEFYPYPGSKTPRMRFHVAGYFLVKDNKIEIWRDFSFPGAQQLIEPAPKA